MHGKNTDLYQDDGVRSVTIIGLGFVGLSTAVVFASRGIKVIGIEIDKAKSVKIKKGIPHFYEPKLETMLQDAIKRGYLHVTDSISEGLQSSELVFIAVGTPSRPDGSSDLSYIKNTAAEIGKAISHSNKQPVVVVKSTVPPGTTEGVVARTIQDNSAGKKFSIASNPEFLKEGSAIDDTLSPHILVIGSQNQTTTRKLLSLYRNIYKKSFPQLIETNIPTAELIKYSNNAFLATKISFINTVANICSRIPGADVEVVAKAIGLDPRIGKLFLKAGPGYGGSCFPKDVSGFIHFSKNIGYDPILLESTKKVNDRQYFEILDLVLHKMKTLKNKKIAILGLAFKKNTDDIRESVPLKLISELKSRGAELHVHDPLALNNAKLVLGNSVKYFNDKLSCIKGTQCCIIMTEWEEYGKLSHSILKKYMAEPILVDARRVIDPRRMRGVEFAAIGLGHSRKVG